jgi:hypothetical protein
VKSRIQIRDPDQGRKTRIIFLRARKPFFWVEILNYFMRIRDPVSGMEKIWIRDQGWTKFGSKIRDQGWKKFGSGILDKHPGSAKLEISSPNLLGLKESYNNQTL